MPQLRAHRYRILLDYAADQRMRAVNRIDAAPGPKPRNPRTLDLLRNRRTWTISAAMRKNFSRHPANLSGQLRQAITYRSWRACSGLFDVQVPFAVGLVGNIESNAGELELFVSCPWVWTSESQPVAEN